jgi:hypothetical protein
LALAHGEAEIWLKFSKKSQCNEGDHLTGWMVFFPGPVFAAGAAVFGIFQERVNSDFF